MQSIPYKLTELFIIFIITPISFLFEYPILIKLIIGVLGFLYIIYVLLKVKKNTFKIQKNLNWKQFWIQLLIKLLVIAVVTVIFVWATDKESLFEVLLNKPKLWLMILFFYTVFSVYPQELIYRTFFFQRYQSLFKNERIFILINAALFSLAHLFFKNTLVVFLTFIGGIIFAFTFQKTKSTLLVSIEHAIYGCWLFTVGMGNMLGFPS
jgi:membrane protease YdiL (CAAX protease family)